MTTLADITAAIADDVDDTTGEYGAQITSAVLAAIRYCERKTYYFNETRDVTFTTVADQDWYGSADNSNIPTLVKIQAAFLTDSSGQTIEIFRTTPEHLELLLDASATSNKPYWWTYFGQRIRLYPKPDVATYTVRLQLGPYRLTPLVNPSDTNAWLDEAYDMVKARAKYVLYKDTIKEPALAAEALNDFEDQKKALKAETAQRNGTGNIRPTQF